MNQLLFFGGSFFAHTPPDILIKHGVKETADKGKYGVYFIYPKLVYQVVVKEYDKISCYEKGVNINTNRDRLFGNV